MTADSFRTPSGIEVPAVTATEMREIDRIGTMNETAATVVSLDVPSGRNATTGREPGPAVDPGRLRTLALPKTGLDMAYTDPFGEHYWVELES